MAHIISFDIIRKTASRARVELSNGEVYVVIFAGLLPYQNKDLYSKALERILNDFENGSDADLTNYVTYRMACEKLETPLSVATDRNRDRERIGQRIREIRTAKGMEAKTLALRSQIDAANVSRIEQGKYSVGLDILCKIALALDSRVDIVPNRALNAEEKHLSLSRRIWLIPTMEVDYEPSRTLPGCRFSLWPNNFKENINIGDLVVFYLNNKKDYSGPHLISDTKTRHEELGVYSDMAQDWPVSENNLYLKVEYYSNLPEAEEIQIREAARKYKGELTEATEIKL